MRLVLQTSCDEHIAQGTYMAAIGIYLMIDLDAVYSMMKSLRYRLNMSTRCAC